MTRTSSFYLGPRKVRLQAHDWEDLVVAAAAGVLDENHWVELKQAVPASSKGANMELAKDLASLSVDGGVLIIGIEDAGGAAGAVVGTAVEKLKTRIAQVASMSIDPPLPVTIDIFDKPDEPGVGTVVVSVPASEGAPHQVDQRYWGRDDHGKRVLSNDEIRRLLADRQARAAGFADRLHDLPSRLDTPGLPDRGRLYMLLEPGAESQEPVSELLRGQIPLQVTVEAVRFRPMWSPSLHSVNYNVPHPDGLAATSSMPETPDPDRDELNLLLSDDGSVLVAAPVVRPYGRGADAPLAVFTGHVLETLHSCIQLAAHIADQRTGYQGPWRAGVLFTQLRGLLASQAYNPMSHQRFVPYPADVYVMTTDTTTREMTEEPPVVVERLAKRLLRGLGVADRFLPYRDPAEIAQRSS